MVDEKLELINKNKWDIDLNAWQEFDDYTKEYIYLNLANDRTKNGYIQRIKAIDFINHKTVLDAACGIGQWSNALAECNEKVIGIDLLDFRIDTAKKINAKKENTEFILGSIEKMPFEDNSFDAVHCRGVLMLADAQKIIQEISRVLKPEGKVFINYDGYGYYLFAIFKHGIIARNKNVLKSYYFMIKNTLLGSYKNSMINPKTVKKLLKENDIKLLEHTSEAMISRNDTKVKPLLKKRFFGFIMGYELLGEKCKSQS